MLNDLKQLFEYRELLRTLVSKDVRSRYKGSVLGFAWNFAIPLMQLLVFWILFGIIVKVQLPEGTTYPFALFLFTGLLPWNFFANSLTSGSASVLVNANLVKKIYFPLQVLPLTAVMSQFISFLLGLTVLAVIVIAFQVGLSFYLLLLPVVFVVQLLFVCGLAYLFACLNVFFRDVEHILGIVVMAWMYLTPILYPISMVDERAAWAGTAVRLNPMTGIITAYQDLILNHQLPDLAWFGYSTGVAILAFVIGFKVFNHGKYRFEEEV